MRELAVSTVSIANGHVERFIQLCLPRGREEKENFSLYLVWSWGLTLLPQTSVATRWVPISRIILRVVVALELVDVYLMKRKRMRKKSPLWFARIDVAKPATMSQFRLCQGWLIFKI
jgi:hypothetical protein